MTLPPSRVLVVLSYADYLRLFGDAIQALTTRGIEVVLAFDKRRKNEEVIERAAALGPVEWTTWRPGEWQVLLEETGAVADYMRFMAPEFANKQYLRRRMEKYLPERFSQLRGIHRLPTAIVRLVWQIARLLEAVTPEDEGHTELLQRVKPAALIVSPVILRGPSSARQTQLVKTAQRLGVPVAIAVGSWDHLSSKGLLRVQPDRLLVWNSVQRDEAVRFHGVRPASVIVTGAHPWQCWFDMEPTMDRDSFAAMAGLPPNTPYLLYVGSSRGIAEPEAELQFVHDWLRALRSAKDVALRRAAVLIRPHPANRDHWLGATFDGLGDVVVWPAGPRPVFMRPEDMQAYYHSIFYSDAVIGINTSAMIEATIIGRPVFSIRQPHVAQAETVHFEYLTPAAGGSTVVADSFTDHVEQLASTLREPGRLAAARDTFLRSFVNSPEPGRMPVDSFVDAVERLMQLPRRPRPVRLWLRPVGAVARRVARRLHKLAPSRVELRNPSA